MSRLRRAAAAALVTSSGLVILFGLARHFDPLPEGVHGSYFATSDWSSAPIHLTLDPQPSTERLVAAWAGNPPLAFSATWSGSVITFREGTYTFATASDDGSWVYVDEMLVVENGGRHGTQLASGSIHLTPGVHAIFIRYFQDGGDLHFDLLWSRTAAPLRPVPSWALRARRPSFPAFLASVAARRSVTPLAWLWLATLFFFIAVTALPWCAVIGTMVARDRWLRALAAVVGGSVVLNIAGIWWGLPGTWAGDEITPQELSGALAQHFSGGWFNRYPPLHFYVLSTALSPWLLIKSLGWINPPSRVDFVAQLAVSRLVSVAAGIGTLAAVYASGAVAFGKRAGVFAAAMMALVAPYVFYAKTANPEVPYVCWFAVSLVFYLRFLRTLRARDLVFFASAATCAICTKDQAYALYLAAPFVIVYHLWESNRARQIRHPIARALLDWRLGLATVVASVLFAAIYKLPFNWHGFIAHVRDITGPGVRGYQAVTPTIAGRLMLLKLTADLDQRSWGWPLWIVCAIGVVLALKKPESRRVAVCLMLVVVSYYFGFIDVILYNYDRYLLPVCIVQALLGGVVFDRFLRSGHDRVWSWKGAVVVAVFAYSLLYAATVDVLMIRDSRYTIERWLRGHAGRDELVGTMFSVIVLPRLDDFRAEDIGTIDGLRERTPAFYVLNTDYARAIPPESLGGQLIAGLEQHTLGYTLALRYRSPPPWSWLPGGHPDLVGPRVESPVSFLRDINPTTEIYRRDTR